MMTWKLFVCGTGSTREKQCDTRVHLLQEDVTGNVTNEELLILNAHFTNFQEIVGRPSWGAVCWKHVDSDRVLSLTNGSTGSGCACPHDHCREIHVVLSVVVRANLQATRCLAVLTVDPDDPARMLPGIVLANVGGVDDAQSGAALLLRKCHPSKLAFILLGPAAPPWALPITKLAPWASLRAHLDIPKAQSQDKARISKRKHQPIANGARSMRLCYYKETMLRVETRSKGLKCTSPLTCPCCTNVLLVFVCFYFSLSPSRTNYKSIINVNGQFFPLQNRTWKWVSSVPVTWWLLFAWTSEL